MTSMRPPQRGHGRGSTRGSSGATIFWSSGSTGGGGMASSSRACAMLCGAIAVGEQAVVADAVEAFGQDVHQEAADELGRRQRHGLVAAGPFDPVVLLFERHAHRVG